MKLGAIKDNKTMPVTLVGVAVCAVLLLMGWLIGLGPLMSESQQATKVVAEADAAEAEAKISKAELDRLQKDLKAIKKRLKEQPVGLKPARQINPLLMEIAAFAKTKKLSITGTRAGQPVALAFYDYVPIELSGEGTYADLLGFIRHVHEQRGDLGVVAFSANRTKGGAALAFDIKLAWYVLSDNTGAKHGATAAAPQTP